ncbi:MAG: hypothetical protein ACJ762_06475 [Solirubrobacteraceae bacterium]
MPKSKDSLVARGLEAGWSQSGRRLRIKSSSDWRCYGSILLDTKAAEQLGRYLNAPAPPVPLNLTSDQDQLTAAWDRLGKGVRLTVEPLRRLDASPIAAHDRREWPADGNTVDLAADDAHRLARLTASAD